MLSFFIHLTEEGTEAQSQGHTTGKWQSWGLGPCLGPL